MLTIAGANPMVVPSFGSSSAAFKVVQTAGSTVTYTCKPTTPAEAGAPFIA